jgi:hypothetical protein
MTSYKDREMFMFGQHTLVNTVTSIFLNIFNNVNFLITIHFFEIILKVVS